jgi:hypothetical protein
VPLSAEDTTYNMFVTVFRVLVIDYEHILQRASTLSRKHTVCTYVHGMTFNTASGSYAKQVFASTYLNPIRQTRHPITPIGPKARPDPISPHQP